MSALLPQFHEPTYEDARLIPTLWQCPSRVCEYSFANMMMWRKTYHTKIAEFHGAVYIRFGEGEDSHYMAPCGGDFHEGVQILKALCERDRRPLLVFGYDDEGMDRLSLEFRSVQREEFRDEFDYIYRVSDLAELPGRKYHGKRNHIAAFSRKYNWRYETLSDQNVTAVHTLADRWCSTRVDEDGSLAAENASIHELLEHRDEAQLKGGVLFVGEEAVAFTFGAPLCADTFDTLVEKALPEYADAYAVINREFAARELSGFTYVNRENDVGAEGLRRAKLSYHPVMLVKKTLCTVEE